LLGLTAIVLANVPDKPLPVALVQLVPPSVLRKTPSKLAAYSVFGVLGATASAFTLVTVSPEFWLFQFAAESVVLKKLLVVFRPF